MKNMIGDNDLCFIDLIELKNSVNKHNIVIFHISKFK